MNEAMRGRLLIVTVLVICLLSLASVSSANELRIDTSCFHSVPTLYDDHYGDVIHWYNHGISHSVTCDLTGTNLTSFEMASFWMHSAIANDAELIFQLYSDNPNTDGSDYYRTSIIVDWEGWKEVRLPFREFVVGRDPLGWDGINRIRISASGWGVQTKPNTNLRISDITFVNEYERTGILEQLRADHPRLLICPSHFGSIQRLISKGDPHALRWYAALRTEASEILRDPPSTYEIPDGLRLWSTSRRVLNRVEILATMYRLDQEDTYLNRAWLELEAAGTFPDWNPRHFLDTAEMTRAFAIAYDWLYDVWSPEQREFLREAIVDKGLKPALLSYRGVAPYRWHKWPASTNNWNFVVNGGIAMGALAVADYVPELAEEIISRGLNSVQLALGGFAPDGAWDEGLEYWNYSISYLVPYIAALETALNTSFGLADTPGLEETGYYPIYMTGPTGSIFNFSDNVKSLLRVPEQYWLSRRFGKPEFAFWQHSVAASNAPQRNLLWYHPSLGTDYDMKQAPLDRYFRHAEVITFRSAWEDEDALFVGFKAGDNQAQHGDLDAGTFVVDAFGTRWAEELGKDDYNLKGYFNSQLFGERWTYYRKRTEGQNTIVINPDGRPGQELDAFSRMIYHASSPEEAVAIADLTPAYVNDASRVLRGIALLNDRTEVLIQDEITTKTPSEIWWFMHTEADVQLSEDQSTALLTRSGKRLLARILSPGDIAFQVLPAQPLSSSPNPPGQTANLRIQKLSIHLEDVEDVTLVVHLIPLVDGQITPFEPEIRPLDEWVTKDSIGTLWPAIKRITLDMPSIKERKAAWGVVPIELALSGPDDVINNVHHVVVFMDDEAIYEGETLPVDLSLDTLGFDDGRYTLSAEVWFDDKAVGRNSFPLHITNFRRIVDAFEPPVQAGFFGTIDRSKTSSQSEGWDYGTEKADTYFGDTDRRVRQENTKEHLVWEMEFLREFGFDVYSLSRDIEDVLIIQVSEDGEVWKRLSYDVYEIEVVDDLHHLHLSGHLDGEREVHWLKLTLNESQLGPNDIQLGEAMFVGQRYE